MFEIKKNYARGLPSNLDTGNASKPSMQITALRISTTRGFFDW
jgi:hypothetical protein